MSEHGDKFNALPDEVREIACNLMLEYQIRDLYLEKERLHRRYCTSRNEINDKIRYCELELATK